MDLLELRPASEGEREREHKAASGSKKKDGSRLQSAGGGIPLELLPHCPPWFSLLMTCKCFNSGTFEEGHHRSPSVNLPPFETWLGQPFLFVASRLLLLLRS